MAGGEGTQSWRSERQRCDSGHCWLLLTDENELRRAPRGIQTNLRLVPTNETGAFAVTLYLLLLGIRLAVGLPVPAVDDENRDWYSGGVAQVWV
jgi:hypothetical protein